MDAGLVIGAFVAGQFSCRPAVAQAQDQALPYCLRFVPQSALVASARLLGAPTGTCTVSTMTDRLDDAADEYSERGRLLPDSEVEQVVRD